MKTFKMLICVILVVILSSASVQAGVVTYNFDDGTLQGWTNDAGAGEDYVAWDTAANNNSGRTIAHSADYMVLEADYGNRDSGDTAVKILTSPEFMATAGTAIEIWTLGGTGAVATPTWTNYADLPATAGSDFMGAALRRVSDGEYLLFSRRSGSGQSGRTINWLTIGWDASEISTAVAGDDLNEMYVVDIIDAYSGGWGWLGVDDVTVVPEPATLTLLGLASVLGLRRRRS
ncbi:MAG: PEP-CTERM sorting domain-containing protein [Anaerohalosphaera sp.]|nr:PEP-CTERM sorting domain-containing protein [Anaerohalosphaera sp.]